MIKNILYSLFLHSFIVVITHFSFSANPPIDIDKATTIEISFVAIPKAIPTVISNSENATLNTDKNLKTLIPTHQDQTLKKDNPKPEKFTKKPNQKPKNQPKEKPSIQKAPKIVEKTPITKPKIVEYQAPEPKKDKIIKPEIKAQDPQEKVPDVKNNLEEKNVVIDVGNVKEDQEDQEEQYDFTKKSIDNLYLLVREKFNIQNQIKRCYQNALKEDGNNKMAIYAHIFIAKNGFINTDLIIFKEFAKNKNLSNTEDADKNQVDIEQYNKAIKTVKKALKFCNPIRNMPQDKYNVWKEIDLQFDFDIMPTI
jgi:hypothetical protein